MWNGRFFWTQKRKKKEGKNLGWKAPKGKEDWNKILHIFLDGLWLTSVVFYKVLSFSLSPNKTLNEKKASGFPMRGVYLYAGGLRDF